MPVVWTIEEKCKRCYSCIRECPAKAIKVEHGQAKVIKDRCVGCGHCVQVCSQRAKAVLNGVGHTINLLKQHDTVVMLAPSFPAAFPTTPVENLVGALRECGFSRVVEVAFGADLINRAYGRLINLQKGKTVNGQTKPIITSSCPAINQFIQKFVPELVNDLATIVSPMIAMGRVVKERYGDVKTVFVGPCTAKKLEFLDTEVNDAVDEVLTFAELNELFNELQVNMHKAPASHFDPPTPYLGRLYPISGGLLRSAGLPADLMNNEVIVTEGKQRVLKLLDCLKNKEIQATLVDVLFCDGCINGPFMDESINYFARKQSVVKYTDVHRKRTNYQEWQGEIDQSKMVKVSRTFEPEPLPENNPTDEQIRAIFAKINKVQSSDELNCGACGYQTCREYATAVFQNLAEDEMCLPFLIDKQLRMQKELENSLTMLAETQEQLIQHEKLASIGQLAAGVAHEVNNPLGSILLYSHLVLQRMEDTDTRTSDIKFIMAEAKRCQKIVSGLLNFSRQNKLDLKQHSIKKLIDKVISIIDKQAEFKSIRINMDIDENIPDLEIDADQIYQVFLNLIVNAGEAMPDGGQLDISAIVNYDTNRVIITFKDTGIGITKENISKLFTPFFTTKQIGKGTGLGLAIAYGIIKMHKGHINVKSDPGVGSTFSVELPFLPQKISLEA